jgi:hypothetical protein
MRNAHPIFQGLLLSLTPLVPRDWTPDSDVPPADWRNHREGFEDGFFEDWDGEEDAGGYPDEEAA